MSPFFQGGEVTTWVRYPYTMLREGMVVTFRNKKGGLTVHRIVAKRGEGMKARFFTKGDHCVRCDLEWLTPETYMWTFVSIDGRVVNNNNNDKQHE
jgi:hypothetical protein